METMYCIPDMEDVERVIVTKDVILYGKEAIYDSGKKTVVFYFSMVIFGFS